MFSSIKKIRTCAKKAFSLIEILAVIAIIGILATVVIGLQPGNPRGLDDACHLASTEFRVAQNKAVLGTNPDRDPESVKRYNIRTAVLVLNNPDDEERHLRYIVPVVGGTASESDSPEIRDYYWYAISDTAGVMLPQGVYFVPPTESVNYRSVVTPLEGQNEVSFEPSTQSGGKKFGAGKQKWYVYYFDMNGQTFMSKATFMVAEGRWDPGARKVIFEKEQPATGFAITRNGAIIYMRSDEDIEVGNK